MKNKTILLMFTAVVMSSCSNKQVYDNVQQNAQRECQRLPQSAYQECMEQYSESFESYSQKREELLQ